jgi:hypothetical protein
MGQKHMLFQIGKVKNMNIMGISGLAGSGKDTVSDFFTANYGVVKIAFADPIKIFAKQMWDFSHNQLFGPSQYRTQPDERYKHSETEFLTSRHVLQGLGTAGRALEQDVWARYGVDMAKKLLTPGHRYSQGKVVSDVDSPEVKAVIITDARFINELRYIKQAGGILIRVVRPGSGLPGEYGKHQSETEMATINDSEFNYIINNTGTLEDLKNKVDEIYLKITSTV